jgi:uncharacterized protein (DUF1330 family)
MKGYWVARGRGRYKILEGRHDSPKYQEAAAFRKGGAGEVELVIVEGPTPPA